MRVLARCGFGLLVLAALSMISSCGGSSNATVLSIAIAPAGSVSAPNDVAVNTQADFTATVTLSNPSSITSTTVTWYVNTVSGGSTTTGTIVASGTDNEVGIFTAPLSVPGTNNGVVQITATAPKNPSNTTDTSTVTSNIAYVQITVGVGLVVSPTGATISAGSQKQFTATNNGTTDSNVTWSVSSASGGNVGTINPLSGLYTAPPYPPPGGEVTITATSGTTTATSTAVIIYSDASLQGPYAFSYSGNDSGGFYSVAGSFVANGQGTITNGVEDIMRSGGGGQVHTQVPITGGNYVVGADGRGQALITTSLNSQGNSFRFAMTTNLHAFLIGFDNASTGSGTLDQQNADYLNASVISQITGPYVFAFSGENSSFLPRSVAGRFLADGANGITSPGSIVDNNNNGTVQTSDTSLGGTISIDPLYAASGRGLLTLTSNAIGTLQFAFYVIDNTHFHLVEIDKNAFLGGDVYQGVSGNSFSAPLLAGTQYSFVAGGNSSQGPYAVGGVFVSSGSGSVTSGALDVNNNGAAQLDATLASCSYTVDPASGRIDLVLSTTSGTCTLGTSGVSEFSLYASAQGPWLLLELDPAAVSTGYLFPQTGSPASSTGNFALGLAGQGAFNTNTSLFQPDTSGEVTLAGSSITYGNFDINVYSATYPTDAVSTADSSIVAPTTNGRGTGVVKLTNPVSTYTLSLYYVSPTTTLLLDQDIHRVSIGVLANQF